MDQIPNSVPPVNHVDPTDVGGGPSIPPMWAEDNVFLGKTPWLTTHTEAPLRGPRALAAKSQALTEEISENSN